MASQQETQNGKRGGEGVQCATRLAARNEFKIILLEIPPTPVRPTSIQSLGDNVLAVQYRHGHEEAAG